MSQHGPYLSQADASTTTRPYHEAQSEAQNQFKQFKQFSVEGNDDDSTSNLCAVCKTIDFRKIFSIQASDVPVSGLPVFTLANLHPGSIQTPCLCCAMLISMAFTGPGSSNESVNDADFVWQLRVFRATALWGIPATKDLLSEGVTVFIGLVWADTSGKTTLEQRRESWKRGLILPSSAMADNPSESSKEGFLCKAVKVNEYINGSRIRQMLEVCTSKHSCSKEILAFPQNSHVIDCSTRMIVRLDRSKEYFALSYVWGNENIAEPPDDMSSQNKSSTPARAFPLVVEDAITIVQRSGYRYLWVDRYCIKQHDNDQKQHQIRQMANIYSNAIATICALGAHANVSLPGVSTPRTAQRSFESQNDKLVRCPWPEIELQTNLQSSKWATRGWTFQEPLLSQRCLFFTPETVLQVCQKTTLSDMLEISGAEAVKRSLGLSAKLFDPGLGWHDSRADALPHTFVGEVQEYQQRNFTYQGDTLDAFRGILSIIRLQSYWGVPVLIPADKITPDQLVRAKGFVFGLLWHVVKRKSPTPTQQPSIHPKRVPSWSWVSQTENIVDFICSGSFGASLRTSQLWFNAALTTVVAHIETKRADERTIIIEKFLFEHRRVKCAPETSIFLNMTSVTARWKRMDHGEYPASYYLWPQEKLGKNPVVLSDISYPILQLEAAQLYLDREYSKETYEAVRSSEESTIRDGLAILVLFFEYQAMSTGIMYWLAIRRLDDGTFRREGIIVGQSLGDTSVALREVLLIPRKLMTTIQLG